MSCLTKERRYAYRNKTNPAPYDRTTLSRSSHHVAPATDYCNSRRFKPRAARTKRQPIFLPKYHFMKKISTLCLAMLAFIFSQAQTNYAKGSLEAAQETGSVTSSGSGVVIVKYNAASKELRLYGDYAGLTSTINGSHIHIGAPGATGPVEIPLQNTGGTTGSLSVVATLTATQETALLAGNMYANVHTDNYPLGELRAQLTLAGSQAVLLTAKMQGAQEVPPTTSTATGSAYALVDNGNDSVFVTGSYTGLTAASTMAHVHHELPGTAGPVIFPVFHSAATSGAVHAMVLATGVQVDSMLAGQSYINVHTSTHPSGEIRGQLVNEINAGYFAGELSGASETTPNSSAARGTVIAVYNSATKTLDILGDYQKLGSAITSATLFSGAAGAEGTMVADFTNSGDSTGTISLVTNITNAQETDLLAGNMYVNVFSADIASGEIRTQLMPTAGETHLFTVNLDEDQVRANPGNAFGKARVIVDRSTGMMYATGSFGGINSNITAAHIHGGAVGQSGGVILPLFFAQTFPKPHTGTMSGSGTLAASTVDSMLNGLTYIDVHSAFFTTAPAIRAQLGDLILPVKLTSFSGSKQKNQIELRWEAAEELNLRHYEVQQLNTNTQQWLTKGTVLAKGVAAASYSFVDNPTVYANPFVAYRLKMVDKDGAHAYSSIVKINFDKPKAELFIQTNPVVNGELKYRINGLPTNKIAEVSVIDFNGRLLVRNSVSSSTTNTLPISGLAAGMYKLVVRIDDTILEKSFMK